MINVKKSLTILLCLILFLSVITGCNKIAENDVQSSQVTGQTEQTQQIIQKETQTQEKIQESQQEKIVPSFEVETYETPFIYFEYPSNFIQKSINNPNTILYLSDKNKITSIQIARRTDKSSKTSATMRDMFLTTIKSEDAEIKDKTSFINENIAVFEIIHWDNTPLRFKYYFYTNGNGIEYLAYICTENNNWDNIQEVIKVLNNL